ncbi:hypothetical protein [Haloarchaeobius sp. DYHT-AS-18]
MFERFEFGETPVLHGDGGAGPGSDTGDFFYSVADLLAVLVESESETAL